MQFTVLSYTITVSWVYNNPFPKQKENLNTKKHELTFFFSSSVPNMLSNSNSNDTQTCVHSYYN